MRKKSWFIGVLVIIGIALYISSRVNFLLFHLIVESSILIIGVLIFTVSIISKKFDQNSFITTLGPGILVASLINFLHIVTFKGMNIIPGYDANLPTQLWIVLSYILSVSIFMSILLGNRKVKLGWSIVVFFSLGALGTWMSFAGVFPACFVEGTGLTTFKKVSEYLIILVYLACLLLLYWKRSVFDKKTYKTTLLFVSLLIIGEFMFTLYSDVYGIQNFIGHYFRLIAFLIIYIFVVVESIQKPLNSIFSELKISQQAVEQSPASIVITEIDGTIRYVNKAFELITGYNFQEAIGENPKILKLNNEAKIDYEELWDTILSGKEWYGIFDNKKKNGETYWENTSISPIFDENGNIVNFLAIKEDYTEKHNVRLEQEMRTRLDFLTKERLLEEENQKNIRLLNETILSEKLKTEFFSNLSHELKTPLNVILSAMQLLDAAVIGNDGNNGERALKKYSNIIKQNCYRQLRLVNNMIDITRVDAGFFGLNRQNINIVSVVESVSLSVSEYIKAKSIQLIFDTDIEECTISCDPEKIERVILNLLSNSIKFTKPGGSITVNMYDKKENIIISIKDTGIGIPSDKLEIIFDRFRQVDRSFARHQEGSGIGLSIVKSLVELHGGTISVRSEFGKGTEFIIELPVEPLLEEERESSLVETDSQELIQRLHIEFSDIYSLN